MVNLNFIPNEQKKRIERAEEDQRKVDEKAEGKHNKENHDAHSKDECLQMYDRGFISDGVQFVNVRCRKCGSEKQAAKSSDFYHTKICAICMRKTQNNRSVVEIN
jgi:hypothetical protein